MNLLMETFRTMAQSANQQQVLQLGEGYLQRYWLKKILEALQMMSAMSPDNLLYSLNLK